VARLVVDRHPNRDPCPSGIPERRQRRFAERDVVGARITAMFEVRIAGVGGGQRDLLGVCEIEVVDRHAGAAEPQVGQPRQQVRDERGLARALRCLQADQDGPPRRAARPCRGEEQHRQV
jgi:hypothetical protein